MPYKKNYKKKRPSYYKYGMNALNMASKSLYVANKLKRLINVEFKFHDVQHTTEVITDVPVIIQLTNISEGTTDQTRVGASIKATKLFIRLWFQLGASAVSNVRIMLILDRQTNQAIYSASDLLVDVTTSDNVISPLNLDNKHRFRVLFDRRYKMSNSGSQVINAQISKVLNTKFRYDANAGTIADLTSNSLSLLIVSNNTTNGPDCTLFSRLRYIDN